MPREGLYASILDPNQAINFGFEGWQVETRDGTILAGMITSETDRDLTVRTVGGIDTKVRKSEVVKREKMSASLMPPLAAAITEKQIVDLVEFLAAQKKKHFNFGVHFLPGLSFGVFPDFGTISLRITKNATAPPWARSGPNRSPPSKPSLLAPERCVSATLPSTYKFNALPTPGLNKVQRFVAISDKVQVTLTYASPRPNWERILSRQVQIYAPGWCKCMVQVSGRLRHAGSAAFFSSRAWRMSLNTAAKAAANTMPPNHCTGATFSPRTNHCKTIVNGTE